MSDGTDKDGQEFFGSLRFLGERFKSANLPVDLLDNIKAYQEVLFALAEDIWRERNPDGKRLPRGFRKNISLSFSHVEDGSAKAVLKNDSSIQNGLLSDEFSINYMSLAQTKFLDLSRAANENRLISGVSSSAKKPLLTLISNFREGESLEVRSHTGKDLKNPSVRYSEKTMKALRNAAVDTRIRPIQGMGIIRAILDSSEEIEVLSEHGVFRLPVPSVQLRSDRFPIAAFVEFEIQANVSGSGLVNKVIGAGKVERIQSNGDHYRFLERLKILTDLKEGWKDGVGNKIGPKAARYCHDLSGFICNLYDDVSLFPETDGSIKIEFELRELDVSIICKDDYIYLEVFDESDAEPKEKAFFGLTPKLLADLSDLEGFIN
jgi:hypothetical protein